MINLKRNFVPAVLSALLLATAAVPAHAYTTYNNYYTMKSSIGMARARTIALSVHHGRVINEAMVRGRNGEPVYVFDIRNRYGLYGVGVDAVSGRVIENVKEGGRVYRRPSNFWDRLFAPTHIGPT